ncbi:preprotein translocase subunit YajC [uncultured Capnocytophaga sp.]|jgi:preprotein translocase, yajC subunit|uniref:preprotein translocase subunit YajC n=1 Tax=uncultured Capnocytophaga sp. TaxID=159273 RepID=UPI002622917E|nr:preprotein translocase subunit YajC [uncultured Capnocytophaga sp.]
MQNLMSSNFLIIAMMFVVMYFLMIRPQMKRQKQEKNFIQSMKKGDKVVTKGGMHGRIVELSDDTCVIETLAGKIKFERSAISMELSAKLKDKKEVEKKEA